jgi:hypothetical protein
MATNASVNGAPMPEAPSSPVRANNALREKAEDLSRASVQRSRELATRGREGQASDVAYLQDNLTDGERAMAMRSQASLPGAR